MRIYAPFTIGGPGGDLTFQPFRQIHGDIDTLGIRVGGVAYSCDLNDIPQEALQYVSGTRPVDTKFAALHPHPSHLSVEKALSWIERMQPRRAVLTHLHIDIDYDELAAKLPSAVVPAFDGMVLEF